jgi:tRNA threonylcarbamoyladenosine biosynthesis protein TsaB
MILALKTADNTTDLQLFSATGELKAQQAWESGRRLADELLGQLQEFLRANNLEFSNLTGLIIFSGPGSFTSLRIGHTVLNSLADSLGIPVVGAMGEDWAGQGLAELPSAHLGRPALPHYGAEANVTRPKP